MYVWGQLKANQVTRPEIEETRNVLYTYIKKDW